MYSESVKEQRALERLVSDKVTGRWEKLPNLIPHKLGSPPKEFISRRMRGVGS
jgi:hypothetical protein